MGGSTQSHFLPCRQKPGWVGVEKREKEKDQGFSFLLFQAPFFPPVENYTSFFSSDGRN